jgi:hypothetical protein
VIIALGSSTDTRWLATLLSSDNSRRIDDQLL